MDKVTVGVIGGGFVASQVHIPILSCFEEVELRYVADVRDSSVLGRAYGLESIVITEDLSRLPDCDIALLAVPVGVRTPYVEEFSKRGTAIFSEKPFAVDLATHEKFLAAADKITCDYMSICFGSVNLLKQIILSGIFGRIEEVAVLEGRITGPTGRGPDHYQGKRQLAGGGILMERGCQTIAQLVYILDGCEATVKDASILWQDDLDIDVKARLSVTGSQDFELDYQLSLVRPLGNRVTVVFENAEVWYNHYAPDSTITISGKKNDGKKLNFELKQDNEWASNYSQAYYLKWKRFLDQVSNDTPIDTRFETSYHTTRLITSIYEKASRGNS